MSARFEVVTTAKDRHHARFVAPNNRILFSTESYKRKRGAENAIEAMQGRFIYQVNGRAFMTLYGGGEVEVRYIDDLQPMPRPELPAVGA